MYLPFTLIYDNTSPSQEAQNATVGRTEVENSLSDSDRSKHMRIFDKKCCFKHTYKIEHHCFRRGLESPEEKKKICWFQPLAKKKRCYQPLQNSA